MSQSHGFDPDAECEYSGKEAREAVEISSADGSIWHAVLCMAELSKLLRFRLRQQGKRHGRANTSAHATATE